MGRTLQKIKHRNLILCEGTDDWNFLVEYLNSSERAKDDKSYAEDVDVLSYDGNRNIGAYLQTVQKMTGYAGVKTLLVIGDAEDDARIAEQRLKSALSRAGLSVPDNPGEWERSSTPKNKFLVHSRRMIVHTQGRGGSRCGHRRPTITQRMSNQTIECAS